MKLYTTSGNNTDGTMTQKAITDIIGADNAPTWVYIQAFQFSTSSKSISIDSTYTKIFVTNSASNPNNSTIDNGITIQKGNSVSFKSNSRFNKGNGTQGDIYTNASIEYLENHINYNNSIGYYYSTREISMPGTATAGQQAANTYNTYDWYSGGSLNLWAAE